MSRSPFESLRRRPLVCTAAAAPARHTVPQHTRLKYYFNIRNALTPHTQSRRLA